MGKRLRRVCLLISILFMCSMYLSYHVVWKNISFKLFQSEHFVIDTSTCKIPNINPDLNTGLYIENAGNPDGKGCRKGSRQWTYRTENKLMFNKTALLEDGLKFKDLSCCYKLVTTLEQLENNTQNWTNYRECHQIDFVQTEFKLQISVPFEFISVECSSKNRRKNTPTTSYQRFHPIAQPLRSKSTQDKIKHWKHHSHYSKLFASYDERLILPPNILVLGMNSTSRLAFRRRMTKTVTVLQNMGAVEIKGYTNSEECTDQSMFVPFTGYAINQLNCSSKEGGSHKNCPLIWSRFHQAQYLTAYSNTWPEVNDLHSSLPVDYLVRVPHNSEYGTENCSRQKSGNELMMGYNEALLSMANEQQVPIFVTSFGTTTNPYSDPIEPLDDIYSNSLERMEAKGHLNNTIVLLLGGCEKGHGLYENKLPNMWIWLPTRIRDAYPELQTSLEINSGRLSSPFVLYWTLNFILDKFMPKNPYSPHPEGQPTLPPPIEMPTIPRKFISQHFLKEIPNAVSCADVGVPESLCACNPLQN